MELVFATNNPHKLEEIRASVPKDLELLSLRDIGCEHEIAETAPDLEGNARLKAEHVLQYHGYDAFADDTGLEVKALDGRPGVFSARYAGKNPSFAENIEKLLGEMQGMSERSARFRTIIRLLTRTGEQSFEGRVEGQIAEHPSGSKGFGYDPVFIPNGEERTFAEMEASEKERIGHRGKAVRALGEYLSERGAFAPPSSV